MEYACNHTAEKNTSSSCTHILTQLKFMYAKEPSVTELVSLYRDIRETVCKFEPSAGNKLLIMEIKLLLSTLLLSYVNQRNKLKDAFGHHTLQSLIEKIATSSWEAANDYFSKWIELILFHNSLLSESNMKLQPKSSALFEYAAVTPGNLTGKQFRL